MVIVYLHVYLTHCVLSVWLCYQQLDPGFLSMLTNTCSAQSVFSVFATLIGCAVICISLWTNAVHDFCLYWLTFLSFSVVWCFVCEHMREHPCTITVCTWRSKDNLGCHSSATLSETGLSGHLTLDSRQTSGYSPVSLISGQEHGDYGPMLARLALHEFWDLNSGPQ